MTTVGAVGATLLLMAAFVAAGVLRWIGKRREPVMPLPPLIIPNGRYPLGTVEARLLPLPIPLHVPLPERALAPAPLRPRLADAAPPIEENGNGTGNGTGDGIYEEAERLPSPTETVRFRRPTDEPVQLIPGRLEVLAGSTRHREILFVRVPGKPPHLYLGRDAGPAPQYVGLGSPTVSRRHARFSYADGRWVVRNLSQTNPLVVNDEELSDLDGERPLTDGDRLELGEVVLRFHSH